MVSFKNTSSTGGDGILGMRYQDNVVKYDPSSFYNWEQDNAPIWELEERENFLLQMAGFPGKNPKGVTMVLSSLGSETDGSDGVYDSIENITERIPKKLKFPILIEICTFGALGRLELHNITCEGEGRLEIVNRAFAFDGDATIGSFTTDLSSSPAGTFSHISELSSFSLSSQISNASSTRLQSVLGENVSNWRTHSRWFAQNGPDTDHETGRLTAFVASGTDAIFTDLNTFELQPYGVEQDMSITGLDAAPKSGSGFNFLEKDRDDTLVAGSNRASVLAYGNYFSSVSVKDCQGIIKLTNICSDGASGAGDTAETTTHNREHAFEVNGSEVILDNCAGIRAKKNGFFLKDSDVRVTGSWLGWRNYDKLTNVSRGPFGDGAGVKAVNTNIEFESDDYTDSRKHMLNFTKNGRGMDLRNCTVEGGIKNKVSGGAGVSFLPNGGSSGIAAAGYQPGSAGDTKTSILQLYANTEYGLYSEATTFSFDGRLDVFNNVDAGVYALRSTLGVPQFTIKDNQGPGIHLINSTFIYGTKSDEYGAVPDAYTAVIDNLGAYYLPGAVGSLTSQRVRNRAQFHVDNNSQNVLATKNSTLIPYKQVMYPTYFGRWGGSTWTSDAIGSHSVSSTPMSHHGATPYRKNNLPGIQVNDNSVADFTHLCYGVKADEDFAKGAVAAAHNNSHIVFRGSKGKTTAMSYTPSGTDGANWLVNHQKRSWLCAGVYAANNSTVEFTGPTKISRFGVDALAESTSQIKANPPTVNGTNNTLDVSGWELIDGDTASVSGNHTSLELHSTRACLVANKRSGIDLFALGGRALGRSTESAGNVTLGGGASTSMSTDVLASDVDADAYGDAHRLFSLATSGGHVKFYPNGFTSSIGTYDEVKLLDAASRPLDMSTEYILPGYLNGSQLHHRGTTGGMCVRAVEGSYVDTNLVDFWYEGSGASISGTFYNVEGTGCEALYDEGSIGWVGPPDPPGGGGGGVSTEPFGEFEGEAWKDFVQAGGNNADLPNVDITTSRITGTGHSIGDSKSLGSDGLTQWDVFQDNGSRAINATTDANQSQLAGSKDFYGQVGYQGGENTGAGLHMTQGGMDDHCYLDGGVPKDFAGVNDLLNLEIGDDGSTWCLGSQIQIWNIADTSKIHSANSLINKADPWKSCSSNTFHGPSGKWYNGVALDYYGFGGRMTSYGLLGAEFHNFGIYRLMLGHRGDLKGYYEISALMCGASPGLKVLWDTDKHGGSPIDQINSQGYLTVTPNASALPGSDLRRHVGAEMWSQGKYNLSATEPIFGWGIPAVSAVSGVSELPAELGIHKAFYMSGDGLGNYIEGASGYSETQTTPEFPIPPINMDWQGYMRNWLDESSSNVFQNAKHLASKKVNGVSIYKSTQEGDSGGEGRDGDTYDDGTGTGFKFGVGVRSLNLFDLDRLL